MDPPDMFFSAKVLQVALKTFVDNVCRQVIERHLLKGLPSIFCPENVAAFDDEQLQRIATEVPGNVERRKQLCELNRDVGLSLQDLRR